MEHKVNVDDIIRDYIYGVGVVTKSFGFYCHVRFTHIPMEQSILTREAKKIGRVTKWKK